METDIRNLKKRAQRLDDEVRLLRAPPLIIGHLQDVLDDRTAIVRSSNGTVFQVSLNQRLEPKTLKPGTRVALNQDTLAVIEVLHDAWDPMVSGAEMVTKPDISYDEVAGLDEQVETVREAWNQKNGIRKNGQNIDHGQPKGWIRLPWMCLAGPRSPNAVRILRKWSEGGR
ncbi:hypothetical protein N9V20_02050, partial [Candidatus Poseidoniales archaeon]|nr:hypothetical protein [Candidatus Poseidoniales archaeon]